MALIRSKFFRSLSNPRTALFGIFALFALSAGGFGTSVSAQSLIVRPPSAAGNFLAGTEAMRELDMAKAKRFFLDATESEWENFFVVQRAFQSLAAAGDVNQAADLAQHLIELDPQNEMARLVIGADALKERRYESAIRQLSEVGSGTFVGITAGILKAWAEIGNNDYAAAKATIEPLAAGGLSDFLVFHRALMADVAGQKDEALDLAAQSYAAEPNVTRIAETYVRMLANAARFDEASAVLNDYAEEGLDHPTVLALEADINAGRRPGKLAANVQSGAAELFHSIGAAIARDGSTEIATIFLRLGVYMEPRADIISMALGNLLERAERFEDANHIYDRIRDDSPLKSEAIVRIAQNIDALGDHDEAIRRLRNITVAQPDNVDAISALGDMLRFEKNYAEAAVAYTAALELVGGEHPRDWRFYYVRGISYERTKQWPLAEADFLKALELNPGQPQVLNYLGYSWVDQGLNLDQALEMIAKAIEWDPTDGYVVDSLGWAYYRLGRIEEAVQTLEQAVQLRPDDGEVNDHLGDAYWKAGRRQEARFQWTIAIDVDNGEGNVVERATRKLANGLTDADSDQGDDQDESGADEPQTDI